MILTVTLNLALDSTYHVDRLQPHETHRVRSASTQAGGKAVMVARVLHALNQEALVMGLAGGATGAAVRDDLDASGLPSELVAMSGENRRTVVVLSGSLPPGIPSDAYAVLTRLAEANAVRVIVDASGEPLRAAVQAGPHVIKPNATELAATTGIDDAVEAAAVLRESGTRTVVASLGPAGLLAMTSDGTWRARPPERLSGNPAGAARRRRVQCHPARTR